MGSQGRRRDPADFGAANLLPHLPRIRHGRTVLSPARWIFAAGTAAGVGEDLARLAGPVAGAAHDGAA
ncbi:lantibiotic dehydratase [Nonomuraea phyllanthi]|uniref:lantibiotic dehydratase n=1 Tax=Nonomuraea phyllanthi TaxID=2219224 RepID=UPI001D012782